MNDDSLPPDPPRLLGEEGETAELLRSADAEFREVRDESGAFRSVERKRRRRTAAVWGLAGASAAAAVVALAQNPGRFGAEPPSITMTAEPLPAPAPPQPIAVERTEERPAARLEVTASATPPAPRVAEAEPPTEGECRKLTREGQAERAVECFRTLSHGTGLGAQVASYEAAKLSAEVLRDAPRALRLLDEHVARFPSGALRGEVRWLRIQSLERAGRLDEALSESETLLIAPEGRALSSELHWLRASIYENSRRDCQSAVSELVALVGETGAHGDEAEMRRAACLERLGRTSEARAAYEQYLKRAEPRRAEEARAKVEAFRP